MSSATYRGSGHGLGFALRLRFRLGFGLLAETDEVQALRLAEPLEQPCDVRPRRHGRRTSSPVITAMSSTARTLAGSTMTTSSARWSMNATGSAW